MKEQKYKEFFCWLFDKDIELNSKIDIATENKIYYPNEIKSIIDTKYMQRLKKVMQLSTVIIDNENVFHTRYDHSLGTYNNGVKVYLNQYNRQEWREENNDEDKKLEIIASLIELLTHDIGHLTFSHTLETLIGQNGTHEIITNRIISEKLNSELNKINKKLPYIIEKRRNTHEIGTLKEGNIDLDRMDYLVHDVIYIDDIIPEIEELTEKIINKTSIEKVEGVDIPVFENDVVKDVQEFLKFRVGQYKKYYYSNERNALDNLCNCFCKLVSNNDEDISPEFTKYLEHCMENTTNLDLEKHSDWNDINTLNAFIEIAEKSKNNDLVETAISCMPSLNGMINLVYKMVEFPQEVDQDGSNLETLIPDDNERKFYKNIKKYVKGKELNEREKFIRNKLLSKNKLRKDIDIYEFTEDELEQVKENLKNAGVSDEIISQITWESKIRVYSKKFPNFAKTEQGEIVELSKHPDFNLDIEDIHIRGGFIYKSLLKQFKLSEDKIKEIENIFQNYKSQKIEINSKRRIPTIFDKEDSILNDR